MTCAVMIRLRGFPRQVYAYRYQLSAISYQRSRVRSAGAVCSRPSERGERKAKPENGRSRFIAASSFCVIRVAQVTTGASVRLTCVAQVHPYSPRQRAQREYERRPFSRLA